MNVNGYSVPKRDPVCGFANKPLNLLQNGPQKRENEREDAKQRARKALKELVDLKKGKEKFLSGPNLKDDKRGAFNTSIQNITLDINRLGTATDPEVLNKLMYTMEDRTRTYEVDRKKLSWEVTRTAQKKARRQFAEKITNQTLTIQESSQEDFLDQVADEAAEKEDVGRLNANPSILRIDYKATFKEAYNKLVKLEPVYIEAAALLKITDVQSKRNELNAAKCNFEAAKGDLKMAMNDLDVTEISLDHFNKLTNIEAVISALKRVVNKPSFLVGTPSHSKDENCGDIQGLPRNKGTQGSVEKKAMILEEIVLEECKTRLDAQERFPIQDFLSRVSQFLFCNVNGGSGGGPAAVTTKLSL